MSGRAADGSIINGAHFMKLRILVAVLLGGLAPAAASRADGPAPRAENVIVVTLDGFRHQEFFAGADESLIDPKAGGVRDVEGLRSRYWRDTAEARREALLPFIWGTVAREGQIFGDRSRGSGSRVTNGKKFSYPGYSEMFCGFGDPRIDSNDKVENPNGSVLEFLDGRPDFRGRVAAFCTWDVFPSILRAERSGLKVHAGWAPIADEPLTKRQRLTNLMLERLPRLWPDNVYDALVMEAVREHLLRHKPRVLYIALGETDEWAHGRRYDLYLQAAFQADRFVGELWRTAQELPEYRGRTALVLTTDHGRGGTPADWPNHGENVDGAEDVWIAVMGPGTPAAGVREGVESTQSQVAATIAGLVGEDLVAANPKAAPPLPGVCPTLPSGPAK
jgi:hypothetical protein